MSETEELAIRLSVMFSSIYFHCHPTFTMDLSHQAVRALQYIQMTGPVTVQQIAEQLGCAHNTASEILRRLQQKGLIAKGRRTDDERVVEVRLTEVGEQVVLEQTGLDVTRLAARLAQVSAAERQRMVDGMQQLLNLVKGG
ncbi:MarR family transcriptional regulator [Alicyclobacillus contaminans]|uniref:MarR family winged helix-turn-helix transcriptional regulator n=1 Tax=Alicyclobacillus contaminans TaxID=392016 RepID=UPI000400CC73|nr:MarR family transcriptional regulator [Alicyclobacillus contaminans]GMA49933.1 MarR family transcriptional regulator [Alicyclobacillus contaminans]